MSLISLATAALNQTPLDWSGNRQRIVDAIRTAREAEAQLLLLPELCVSGYGCEDMFHAEGLYDLAWQQVQSILPHTQGIVVALGVPVLHANHTYNAVALLVDERLAGLVWKQFLPNQNLFYEQRWFRAGAAGQQERFRWHNLECPLGDLFFDVGGVRVGFEICEDAWVPNRPGNRLAAQNVDLLLNPSASPFSFGKLATRRQLVADMARTTATTYAYANLLGNEAGRIIYEGCTLIAHGSSGVVAAGPIFSFAESQVTTATVDLAPNRLHRRQQQNVFQHPHSAAHCIFCPFSWQSLPSAPTTPPLPSEPPADKRVEFTQAVTLGLWDYLRKSCSRGFVISASGGADSSALIVLVWLMLQRAHQELGAATARDRLGAAWPEDLPTETGIAELMSHLLLTLYQASEHSSETTRRAARNVAESVGATHWEFDIQPLLKTHKHWVEQQLARPLDWQRDDIPLQNIQARVRAPGAWFLTNLRGALLLSTSNRSEAAVGYTTMDGDTAGSLSPLGGIDKAFLRQWLRWLEETGIDPVGPLPFLRGVNEQQPTAELRPAGAEQRDEEDLMPYAVLDAIERAAIRDRRLPLEIWQRLQPQFPALEPAQLARHIERFFRLWCRNQWKRERLAPSFHLDEENLDPKTWCRFPILSGNFETELEQLRIAVQQTNAL
jgi:NAD+ synthase (glutamine-hydrolysing)